MFPSKLVQVTGNLSKNNVQYRLCPNTEFSKGVWQMAISVICIEANVEINQFCTFSSSFSVNKQYSREGETHTVQQPISTIYVNLKKGSKSINRFSFPIWVTINRLSDVLDFQCSNSLNGNPFNPDCEIAITLMFRKTE
ncbi:MAG: hypothetical protein FJ333_02220 [Sphingomonadales bacterium]|nr:hypothetical protein [Sphingomonadales bacterium]